MPELLRPGSVGEAAGLISSHGAAAAVLAGGTSLLRETHASDDGYLIALDRLGLDRVDAREGGWSVGAAASLSALRAAVPVPALQAATREIGGPAVQNMATVGGNLYARAPFGDLAPALLALGARLVFASADGETEQPIEAFYAGWADGAPPAREPADAGRDRRALGPCRLPEVRPAPLFEPRSGHGRGLGGEGWRRGERRQDRVERRERASLPLRCGRAGGDRLDPGRGGAGSGGAGGRSGRRSPDRRHRHRVVSPAHGRCLYPPRTRGARLTAGSGRQGWKPS